jgi:putative tryptophan/tyrosine transport system substrate-binding protein
MNDGFMLLHREAVRAAATRDKVPTIYTEPAFAREGGLMSYAPSLPDMLRAAAGYVDRIYTLKPFTNFVRTQHSAQQN